MCSFIYWITPPWPSPDNRSETGIGPVYGELGLEDWCGDNVSWQRKGCNQLGDRGNALKIGHDAREMFWI